MKLLRYNPKAVSIWASPAPAITMAGACSTTLQGKFAEHKNTGNYYDLLKYLLNAEHGNPLEHCVMHFALRNISRSCAAQLTRHRSISWTSSSTHYQNHSDYNGFTCTRLADIVDVDLGSTYLNALEHVEIEEARQVLPLATEVVLLGTVNARGLYNFFRQRLCLRNTLETVLVSIALHNLVKKWWPDLAELVGPPCFFSGCNQGKMACKYLERLEVLKQYGQGVLHESRYTR